MPTLSVSNSIAFANLRDFETGAHLQRMSRYARLVAKELAPELELTDEFVERVCDRVITLREAADVV